MRTTELTRPLILGLLAVGLVVFAVEGLLVYRFYISSSPTNVTDNAPDSAARNLPEDGSSAFSGADDNGAPVQRVGECEEGEDECVQDLVSGIAPEAEYVGGRIDTGTEGTSQSRNILYFEDPTMQPCQHKKLEYLASDESTYYVVVIAGQGSYEQEGEITCVPEV